MLDLDTRPASWTVVGEIDVLGFDPLTGPFFVAFAVVTLPFEVSGAGARGFGLDVEAAF